jgi:hypothetical protein
MNEGTNRSGATPPVPHRAMACAQMPELSILYACGELGAEERGAVDAHAQSCTRCADLLVREQAIQQLLAHPVGRQEPSEILLAQCRSELAEALDDAAARTASGGWLEAFRPARWLVQSFVGHPAWSAALLVLFGVALGALAPQWVSNPRGTQPGAGTPSMTVSAGRRLSPEEFQNLSVAGINYVADNGSGQPDVELHMTAEKPIVLAGSPDDTEVRRVLTFVVTNGQRFDPGVRLDSLEVLRTRTGDADVRRAICAAARSDSNPGVRLKALEALRGASLDDQVRGTLLDALAHDANPGVRVEAINLLSAGVRALTAQPAPAAEQELLRVLRDHMERDPSNYVRLQSAAAIRDLGPRRQY